MERYYPSLPFLTTHTPVLEWRSMSDGIIMCSTIFRDAEKIPVPVDQLTFRPSVYGVLVKDDQVLLHGYMDGYDFPGGGLNPGEDLREGLKREFREETGVSVDVGSILHVTQDFFIHPATQKPYHTILIYLACSNPRGEVSTEYFDEHEQAVARAAEWKSTSELAHLRYFNPLNLEQILSIVEMAKTGKGI